MSGVKTILITNYFAFITLTKKENNIHRTLYHQDSYKFYNIPKNDLSLHLEAAVTAGDPNIRMNKVYNTKTFSFHLYLL